MGSCCTVSMTLLQVLYVTLMDCAVLSSRLFSGSFLQILWLCLALLALFFSKSSSFCQLFSLCFHIASFVVAFSSLLSKAWLPCKLNSFVRHCQHFSSLNLLLFVTLCFRIVPFVVAFSSLLSKAWLPCKPNSFVQHRQHFSSLNLLLFVTLCFHIVPFVVAFSSLLSKAWLPCKLNSFVRHRQHFSSVNLLDNPPSFCQLSVFHIVATFCCSFLLRSFQKHGHLAKYYVYSVLNW